MDTPLWRPSAASVEVANLTRFRHYVNDQFAADTEDSVALHRFSVEEPAAFWEAIWDFCGVIGDKGDKPYLTGGGAMPGARFFPGATLNFTGNLLSGAGDGPAMIFRGEDGRRVEVSRAALYGDVSRLSQGFAAFDLASGDRVAAVLPNIPQAVTAMLSAAALGGVWSSCSPDFGVKGILDRFGQIAPRILIVCDGYFYNGKTISIAGKLKNVLARLPSVERVIVVDFIGEAETVAADLPNAVTWEEALDQYEAGPIAFKPFAFSHPLYILFSSGTTGAPKCIVHSAGGTLLQHLKEHQLHCDLKANERLFYFTTLGWMMWNWLVSGLASGATLLLYDGSPFYPDGNVLFDTAQAEKMTVFGTSAKFIDAVKKAGLEPAQTHDLSSVRLMASTGSPLAPEGFDFVYKQIKPDVQLASIAGGTDIVACFVLGDPTRPVWRGEIQGPGLGMATDVFGESGAPLKSGKGELVCTKPFPSMPIGFWNDPTGEKYTAAYFTRFPGVWHHGDFAEWTEHGGMIIHGRSDATLNPGGVRIGTAEIYAQVEQLPQVKEAIAIGQDWQGDVRIVLFVVLADGAALDGDLRDVIKQKIRTGASPRHVPAKIISVADIPRTKSGKITELAVRDVVHGREVKNKEALANPEALEFYRGIGELGV